MSKTLQERFDEKYTPEPMSGCWLWTAGVDRDGYGMIGVGVRSHLRAHRASWKLHRGDPADMLVCHRCDNTSCVNPNHLFLGTSSDNVHDMVRKERSKSHFTEADVLEMRRLYAAGGLSYRALGVKLGVPTATVQHIVERKTWKHL